MAYTGAHLASSLHRNPLRLSLPSADSTDSLESKKQNVRRPQLIVSDNRKGISYRKSKMIGFLRMITCKRYCVKGVPLFYISRCHRAFNGCGGKHACWRYILYCLRNEASLICNSSLCLYACAFQDQARRRFRVGAKTTQDALFLVCQPWKNLDRHTDTGQD